MTDYQPNIPDVVAEVRERFERYEQALLDKDVEVLDDTFWNSPYTTRLSFDQHGYGFDMIHQHRLERPSGPSIKESRLRVEILTLGRDLATVSLVFKVRGQDAIGRQTQTWVRLPELGWKVVNAHVSTTKAVSPAP